MEKTTKTLDDLMHKVFTELVNRPFNISTSRGDTSEIQGVILRLDNPRARLSRTETKGMPFSALGELLWYLSKSNKLNFIYHYIKPYEDESDDGRTIYGAYGPRLFNWRRKRISIFKKYRNINQIGTVIDLLERKPCTRRAVIQLFDAEDIVDYHREIPCTCTLQFMIRDEKLHLFTCMRSNDAFKGLPHDVFSFTMLQEIIARKLGVEIGTYSHAVGSLHLYRDKLDQANQYLNEGYQSTIDIAMPSMPKEDPWPAIKVLLDAESKIRLNKKIDISKINLDPYWLDLARLLQIHSLSKKDKYDEIKIIQNSMHSNIYNTYIDKKITNHKANGGK
jgi:thymidylate synthase